ncbi:hypothetical protein V1268_000334 [Enterococcus hirae]|uniref:hypothetical protein n=1 Tax=Enterococcus TaxID=1350 RepID=UPI00159B5B5F|nr:hypothetical protein [Enterococcus hirae]EMF0260087.1 hypothetical protein [Enterococcus hirae]MDU1931789.1 hypothetical protein [Enterococcus hirae]QKX71604.1 hypothetical protein HU257_08230 [Enterococcus hirae]
MRKKLSLVSIYVGIITFLLLLIPTKTHADINIKNDSTNSTHKVEFSINEYDGEGSSIWYEIKKGNVEHWKRSASRGYLLAIRDENKLEMYYAFTNANYIYRDGDLYFDHPSYDNYKMSSLKTENHFTTGKKYELTIKNLTSNSFKASISRWADNRDADYFTLSSGDSENWNRELDTRGHLIAVKYSTLPSVYVYYLPSVEDIFSGIIDIQSTSSVDYAPKVWNTHTSREEELTLVNVIPPSDKLESTYPTLTNFN